MTAPRYTHVSVRFVLLFTFFISARITWAQTISGPPSCTKADLDIHFELSNQPDDTFRFVVTGFNISDHGCQFDGDIFRPSVVPPYGFDGHDGQGNNIHYPECKDCAYDLKEGARFDSHPMVGTGQTVRKTFRWKTKPSRSGQDCVPISWISAPSYIIAAPSLLKTACSDLAVTEVDVVDAPEDIHDSLVLTAPKPIFNEREFFRLLLSDKSEIPAPLNVDSCPLMLLWERGPGGETRTDEVVAKPKAGCGPHPALPPTQDSVSEYDLDSGAVSHWSGKGDHELQVLKQIGSIDMPDYKLIRSNVVRIRIIDPMTIGRRWVKAKGLGADLTLDKQIYALGEDVPLHIAIANFDAQAPIYSADAVWDPCATVSVSVSDSSGRQLSSNERFEDLSGCLGHGFGPTLFPLGKIVPLEWSLRSEKWLPKQPGTYTIQVMWSPDTGTVQHTFLGGWTSKLKPYATLTASALFHIE
jgi:hypothetical protein